MKVSIAVINYGMGNLRSVENALLKIGANPVLVESPAEVGDVDGLLLPGVGALEDCVDGLRASKFDDFVRGWIRENRPFMGVCLGLQALFEVSEERDVRGLGVFPGSVVRFLSKPNFKIPHMGWNTVAAGAGSTLFRGIESERFYFVHSYAAQHWTLEAQDPFPSAVVTWATHGVPFVAAVENGPLAATQFHPEKSGEAGIRLLANWITSLPAATL